MAASRKKQSRGYRGACRVDDCGKERHRGDLCRGHYARKVRNLPVETPLQGRPGSRTETLLVAAIVYADHVDGFDPVAFKRARNRLLVAASRFAGTQA